MITDSNNSIYVILGCGPAGIDIAQKLCEDGDDVVVYESKKEILDQLRGISTRIEALDTDPLQAMNPHL
ncbi:MAG: hypothetical protein V3V94_05010, partial [Candidatus Brocadiales bacterium]